MKLKRKDFFKGLAIGTISLPFILRSCYVQDKPESGDGPNVITQKKYEWHMVTTWPPNFPVLGEGCNILADLIRKMSAGRLDIKVYGGGELVPPLEAFDAVRSGAAQMGSGVAYYWAGKAPAAQFFGAVPFGFNAQQMNAWLAFGGGLQLWEELYDGFGLIPLPGGNTGVQMGGWFNKEINGMDDLKGLKMRMPGLGGKVLQRAGGAPVLIAGGEIYTSLERGVIDATEWIGPYHDYLMGFHDIAKYYYYPGWHEPGPALEFFINKEAFEKLPADLQQIVRSAAWQMNGWILSEFEAKNTLYLNKLVNEEGVTLRQFPTEVLDRLRVITEDIVEEIAASDPFSKKVYASFRKFRKDARVWSELTEKVFYNDLQI